MLVMAVMEEAVVQKVNRDMVQDLMRVLLFQGLISLPVVEAEVV